MKGCLIAVFGGFIIYSIFKKYFPSFDGGYWCGIIVGMFFDVVKIIFLPKGKND